MRAAVLTEYGEPLEIQEVDYPEPTPDQVVVETKACGVCRSDWHAWQGDWGWVGAQAPTGQVLGHEPAGVVAEVGADVENFREGDRVAVPFHLADGTCHQCRTGHANVCETVLPLGFTGVAPGAFAEAFPVRKADVNLARLPDDVDFVDMAGLGCRFMTAFHGLAHRADLAPGDWVAVHGCGGVGLSAVHIADALGANVVAVDIREDKLEAARELGASETLNAAESDRVAGDVKALADGGCDVSIDALGIPETCQNAIGSLGRRGQHVQIGLTTGNEQGQLSIPSDAMVMQEVDFLASFGMPPTDYGEIFRMVAAGKLEPGRIVSEELSLDEVPETLQKMDSYDTVGIPVVSEF
ncbi:zinc-dependent alcohol dehydrogenase family protein [Haloarchaeobius sp. DYHT-AS-18]|uniref:zinc-dependent alcohol dehydrogenase family protein n=1 Tax=Haloarchaeobius sp. DYHT-AS-18 TaxID=3446117 RepID=UPI003EBDE843